MLRPRKVKVEQHSYLANRVLDADDLSSSLTRCITILQSQVFSEEFKLIRSGKSLAMSSPLICVSPFIDSVGILRVGVRLSNSSLSYDARHPIILPSNHHVAKLIVHEFHLKRWHASTERTLAQLVQFFWMRRMRAAVRSVVSQCVICRRSRTQPEVPFMSALPAIRLEPFNRPYTSTGLDFFGPMSVSFHRRTHKRYGCILTCLVTRAVHLELCVGLDVDSFLLAFRRFTNGRGCHSVCYSDNGTNFVAGEKVLNTAIVTWSNDISTAMAQRGIKWRFSPHQDHILVEVGSVWSSQLNVL